MRGRAQDTITTAPIPTQHTREHPGQHSGHEQRRPTTRPLPRIYAGTLNDKLADWVTATLAGRYTPDELFAWCTRYLWHTERNTFTTSRLRVAFAWAWTQTVDADTDHETHRPTHCAPTPRAPHATTCTDNDNCGVHRRWLYERDVLHRDATLHALRHVVPNRARWTHLDPP